ncbi:MAG TPA: DUF559 domain-containing protein [Micromonospora sp.]|nr:DUF559 domain-containing protein [Micromonospora sp.]
MTDLYDQAAQIPRLLQGDTTPRRHADLIRSGLTPGMLRTALRNGRLIRPIRDAYLPARHPADLLDLARAVLLVAPPASVLGRQTAAVLHGFGVVPAREIQIVVPAGAPVPQRRGVTAYQTVLPFDGVTELFGLPCLPAARCAIDLARTLPRPDALAVLDAALRAGACREEELIAEVARHDGLRGVRQARELVPLAAPLAECRQETHLRLLLHDGRLPAPTPQLAVADEWEIVRYRLDLGYEKHRLGVEYDGRSHLDRRRLQRDRRRHNWLTSRGWDLRYFTDLDLYRHPELVVATIRRALYYPRLGR